PLLITATGRQCRQMCNVEKHGFPRGKPKGPSRSHGFRTGVVEGIHARYCQALHRRDGYGYAYGPAVNNINTQTICINSQMGG
ncbi:MAG TPA: hypothetical protein VKB35_04900, partial [Ktedonobacteraceae bacterium]|nr:hypothetical protein [Ktedonobacteraceae bacterium]